MGNVVCPGAAADQPGAVRSAPWCASSPAADEAKGCQAAVAREGGDPQFAQAVFHCESRFRRVGLVPSHGRKNPGVARTRRTREGELVPLPGFGEFSRYPTWEVDMRSLARRLIDPDLVDRRQGAQTVGQMVLLWAPANDGNAPAGYMAAVRVFMLRPKIIPSNSNHRAGRCARQRRGAKVARRHPVRRPIVSPCVMYLRRRVMLWKGRLASQMLAVCCDVFASLEFDRPYPCRWLGCLRLESRAWGRPYDRIPFAQFALV